MRQSGKLSYTVRKSPLVRTLVFAIILGLVVGGIFLFNYNNKPTPYIEAITPPVGNAGDIVTITGRNFGNVRDMNYVEFNGNKLTSTSYLSWTENQIKLVIPANISDGLVVVGCGKLRSKPAYFANASDIPVEVQEQPVPVVPVITSFSADKIPVGKLLTIKGNNFGSSRGHSQVLFTIDYDKKLAGSSFININMQTENMISGSDDDYDYEYWSNDEIRVHVPDGAATGVVIVETPNGRSEPQKLTIEPKYGSKAYTDKKIFLLQYSVDLADVVAKESSTITLRCPLPVENPSQNHIEITEVSPPPVLDYYQKTMIHQLTADRSIQPKTYYRQTFVIPVYEITTKVIPDYIPVSYDNISSDLYSLCTKADPLVPADNEKVVELASKIVGKEKNPYKKAKLIYEYMLKEYKIQERTRKADSNPLDLIKAKRGDAYDFAVIYTALCRAAKIPAMTDSGILVSPNMSSQAHFWSEIYIYGVGWIPVDTALGAGLGYQKWNDSIDYKTYYFGNLDSHHVKFSRGWNQLKPFSMNSKIVQRPRSFALQSLWEESSNETVKYSSFWSDPVVKGIY